ncbi:MAG: phosphotransferase, partial [Actinomycetes bacterium]
RDGEVAALLDWDMAVPAPPEWDLAHAAWQFVPLHPPGLAARLGYSPSPECPDAARARRLRLLADEYGLARREGFVDLVRGRLEVAQASLPEAASAGYVAHVRMVAGGHPEDVSRTLAYLDEIAERLEAALLAD